MHTRRYIFSATQTELLSLLLTLAINAPVSLLECRVNKNEYAKEIQYLCEYWRKLWSTAIFEAWNVL